MAAAAVVVVVVVEKGLRVSDLSFRFCGCCSPNQSQACEVQALFALTIPHTLLPFFFLSTNPANTSRYVELKDKDQTHGRRPFTSGGPSWHNGGGGSSDAFGVGAAALLRRVLLHPADVGLEARVGKGAYGEVRCRPTWRSVPEQPITQLPDTRPKH